MKAIRIYKIRNNHTNSLFIVIAAYSVFRMNIISSKFPDSHKVDKVAYKVSNILGSSYSIIYPNSLYLS